jgi:flagellar biosynthesis protein FlhB
VALISHIMQTIFYTMKILLKIKLPLFLLYLAFMSLTGMYSEKGYASLAEFFMDSTMILLLFLLICLVIHISFQLVNSRFHFMKTDR